MGELRIYDYDRRKRAADDDLRAFLWNFDKIVARFGEDEAKARANPTDRFELALLGAAVKSVFGAAQRHGGGHLFIGILREYAMGDADRKVIERAAKTFSKRQMNRVPPEKAVATFLKTLAEYRLFGDTAHRILAEGKKHDSGGETVHETGSFRLINAGGFGPAVMAEVAKVVEKSEKLMRRKGLGRACYGDVHVTNTVHRSTRVLAFYLINDDTLYIRANLKGKQGPAVQSMVHELGHRLQFKFLQGKTRDIKAIYQTLARKRGDARHQLIMDRSKWPKPGDEYVEKGETWIIDLVDLSSRSELKVVFHNRAEPNVRARISLEAFMLKKHPELESEASVFVTAYAMKDADENFAEMVAFYCEDLLPDDQVEMLEAIL